MSHSNIEKPLALDDRTGGGGREEFLGIYARDRVIHPAERSEGHVRGAQGTTVGDRH